jgi:putative addiction module killer protein
LAVAEFLDLPGCRISLQCGERRIDWGPGYRIYLAQDGAQLIVLFGGGTKRRQQADVARAKGNRPFRTVLPRGLTAA